MNSCPLPKILKSKAYDAGDGPHFESVVGLTKELE
jgi:hypothetical protein